MEVLNSQRGGLCIVHGVFLFNFKVKNYDSITWKCSDNKSKCSVRINTDHNYNYINLVNDNNQQLYQHNHGNHVQKIEKMRLKNKMLMKVRESPSSSSKAIFNEIRRERCLRLMNDGEDISVLPKFETIKQSLNRARRKNFPHEPKTINDLQLTGEWSQTHDGKRFLLDFNDSDSKMIMFSTDEFFVHLCNSERLFVDGTFYSAPKFFYQLFTFHIFLHDEMFPVLYVLLHDKRSTTYSNMLTKIMEKTNERNLLFNPKHLHSDFELAIIESFKNFFPSIQIHGCHFHYSQCIYRKITAFGFKTKYDYDLNFKKLIKSVIALALIPINRIDFVWSNLKMKLGYEPTMIKFFDYFESTWLNHDALYPKIIWNHYYNFQARTTNHVEGFHHKLNLEFRKKQPNIYSFIMVLKNFQLDYQIDLAHLNKGETIKYKNSKFVQLNINYIELTSKYSNGELSIFDYVEKLTQIISDN